MISDRKRGALVKAMAIMALGMTAAAAMAAPEGGDFPLPTVIEKMRAHVAAKDVAGVVTYVANTSRVIHLDAAGSADLQAGTPMQRDSIFWIASMSKPITATAVLMLQDEGKLSIDDPVGRHLPELAHLKTADGTEHTVTIRHLLTHTSGMAEATSEESRSSATLAQLIPHFAGKPLAFVPGSQWRYCQSSINTAARIVEVVSGETFPAFLERRLFKPLGMKDTTFYLSPEQAGRLAKSYARTEDGQLQETPIAFLQGRKPTDRDRYPAGNGGLFSTARDYGQFARMILNGGTYPGTRFLKPESVRLMTTVQTGGLQTGFTPGNGWGLGWCVVREPQGVTASLSPGTYGHGGAYGTQAWIDPGKGVVYLLMVQRSNFPNSDASDLRRDFQEAASADLKDL
jgi:CubicO group peptidase (beta-lactamase class C family)